MSACSMGALCCHRSPCAYLDEDNEEKERAAEELADVYEQLATLRAEVETLRDALRIAIEALDAADMPHTADAIRAALEDRT